MGARSTAQQDAMALLTLSLQQDGDELRDLVAELRRDHGDDLVHALVALCRSLCFTTARVVQAMDGDLSVREAAALTDDDVRNSAEQVLWSYGRSAALLADPPHRKDA